MPCHFDLIEHLLTAIHQAWPDKVSTASFFHSEGKLRLNIFVEATTWNFIDLDEGDEARPIDELVQEIMGHVRSSADNHAAKLASMSHRDPDFVFFDPIQTPVTTITKLMDHIKAHSAVGTKDLRSLHDAQDGSWETAQLLADAHQTILRLTDQTRLNPVAKETT